ncbi:hypothetical protein [Entomomonas asaccharolytica]|uniref:Uncharacterized protein n=1 Tax=Entomomonas asaccharolytica TaxID=2785331 RepID=A0A974NE35_9GAMM|nr:hypothetical protein [Entomomonas asaccharolytica]QQP85080.1 hypothetical protein JHT90_11890 [Entomomonas asaccharolytica]
MKVLLDFNKSWFLFILRKIYLWPKTCWSKATTTGEAIISITLYFVLALIFVYFYTGGESHKQDFFAGVQAVGIIFSIILSTLIVMYQNAQVVIQAEKLDQKRKKDNLMNILKIIEQSNILFEQYVVKLQKIILINKIEEKRDYIDDHDLYDDLANDKNVLEFNMGLIRELINILFSTQVTSRVIFKFIRELEDYLDYVDIEEELEVLSKEDGVMLEFVKNKLNSLMKVNEQWINYEINNLK